MKKHITYELNKFEIEEAILLYLAHDRQITRLDETEIVLKKNENEEDIALVTVKSDEDME